MDYKAVIIGTSFNYDEYINGVFIKDYLKDIKNNVDDIIGLNCCIIDEHLREVCTKFITIDYYTCKYLKRYPEIQDKIHVDITVKKEAERWNILPDINYFKICKNINLDINKNELYLNARYPTVLHTGLNYVLKEGLKKGLNKQDIKCYLFGFSLEKNWKHFNEKIYPNKSIKSEETIKGMRESVYMFKNYLDLKILNKQHDLLIDYYNPLNLINKN